MIRVTVDLGAYRRNLAMLRERIEPAQVMAVVKANAYGHGLLPITAAALDAGITIIGALDGSSALAVRELGTGRGLTSTIGHGTGGGIRIFTWLFAVDEDYRTLIENDIELGISYLYQLEQIGAAGAGRPARLHLKIDTGLHRNGSAPEHWPAFVGRALELQERGAVEIVGVWTHIGEASDADDSAAITRFHDAVDEATALGARFDTYHLAASAAGFARPDARFDLVRFGAFTYGIAPGGGVGPSDIGIEPVMTVRAQVTSIVGETATIDIGYAHGLPSISGGLVQVAINGSLMPLLAVGPQTSQVHVTDAAIRAGDTCVLFGPGTSGEWTLQQWADALDTIGEELVVRIAPHSPREYVADTTDASG